MIFLFILATLLLITGFVLMKWNKIKPYLVAKQNKKVYGNKRNAEYTAKLLRLGIISFNNKKHFNWGIFIRQSIGAIIALWVIFPLIKSVRSNVTAAGGNVPSEFDMIITAFPFVIIAIIIGAMLRGFKK